MVALPFLRMPSPVAVPEDSKARSSASSTTAPLSSRSASDTEQPASVAPVLPEHVAEWLENTRLKEEVRRLAQRNLGLRIKLLDKENALLRDRMLGECLARHVADTGDKEGEGGPSQPLADDGSAPLFPPGFFFDSSMEEAQMVAMATWSASAGVPAPKHSRSSRRRAARRYARNAGAIGVYASASVQWETCGAQWPGPAPFEQGWEVEPGTAAATYEGLGVFCRVAHAEDDEDGEFVVSLDDSSEEAEE